MQFGVIGLIFASAALLWAQASPKTQGVKSAEARTPAAAKPSVKAMTAEDVIALLQAGIGEQTIILKLQKAKQTFDLQPSGMLALKKAGASSTLLQIMLDPSAGFRPSATPAAPASPPPAPASAISAGPPLPVTSSVTVNDPNDPNGPHEPGIYLSVKEGDRQVLKALSSVRAQGMHSRGMALHSLTSGIVKAKSNRSIPGERADIRTTDEPPVFYFFMEEKRGGFAPSGLFNNPNEFLLQKLEVRKGLSRDDYTRGGEDPCDRSI